MSNRADLEQDCPCNGPGCPECSGSVSDATGTSTEPHDSGQIPLEVMISKNLDLYGDFVVGRWFGKAVDGQLHFRDNPDLVSLFVMTAGLGGEAGEVQEKLKKFVRDGTFDREKLKKELGDVLYYWTRIATYFGFQPSEVIVANVAKLTGRAERGTLQGSGDNR